MITYPFEFFAPRTLEEAGALLAEHGEAARVLAGGMSLVPIMNLGLASPEVLVSLNHLDGLSYVRRHDGELRIGAMTRHRDLVTSAEVAAAWPALAEAAAGIGDVQVRNRGTVGGSVAHADPAADYLPVLVAAGAAVVLRGAAGERQVPVADFVVGLMETQLRPGEVLTEVRLPDPPAGSAGAYTRLARVEGSFAIANAAVVLGPGGLTVAVGGVRPTPVAVWAAAPAGGSGQALTDAAAEAVAGALGDGAGGEEARYRDAMALVCARRAAAAAARRAAA